MSNETDTKLIVELIKGMGKRLDDVKNEIEGVKTSYQFGSKTSKAFFDKVCEMQKDKNNEQQKQIDNHCERIRSVEELLQAMKPVKRLYEKISNFTVGLIILLGGAVIAVAVFFKDHLITK